MTHYLLFTGIVIAVCLFMKRFSEKIPVPSLIIFLMACSLELTELYGFLLIIMSYPNIFVLPALFSSCFMAVLEQICTLQSP